MTVSGQKEKFIAEGEVLKFDGFLKVYMESSDDESEEKDEVLLPPIEKGMNLPYVTDNALQNDSPIILPGIRRPVW